MGKKLGFRRNPPQSWKQTTIPWLRGSEHYRIPWIKKFVNRLEATDDDIEIAKLKKELERFLEILESGGELPRNEVEDINKALIMGSLSLGQSGVALPDEPRPQLRPRPIHTPRRLPARTGPLPGREPTDDEVRKALETPRDFGYSGDLPIGETWALGPVILTRDSNLRELSNAEALKRELQRIAEFDEEYQITTANHWAVGWVEHLSFHAVDENREPTDIFRWLCDWFDGIENYPIADEEDLSRRESDLILEEIDDAAHRIDSGRPVGGAGMADWLAVRQWLEENGSRDSKRFLEDPENYGVDKDDVERALRDLNMFRADDKFDIKLIPHEDDPYVVTVLAQDRQAALDDQSIEGSRWEAPYDMHEAYALIDNTADLPDRLRTEGYLVDDSEWFWPDAGLRGQLKLPQRMMPELLEPVPEQESAEDTVKAVLNVKGNLVDAFIAAMQHGFRVINEEEARETGTDSIFMVQGSLTDLADWFREDSRAPYPPGSLLLYRLV